MTGNQTIVSLMLLLAGISVCQAQSIIKPTRLQGQPGSGNTGVGPANPLIPSGPSNLPSDQNSKSGSYPYYPYYPVPYPIYPYPRPAPYTPAPVTPAPVTPAPGGDVLCDICTLVDTGIKSIIERLIVIEKKIDEDDDIIDSPQQRS